MAIETTQNLIDWMQKNDPQCPKVSTLANEVTLQNTYGRRCAELLASGELSAKTYAELSVDDDDDDIAVCTTKLKEVNSLMRDVNEIYNGRITARKPSDGYCEKRYSTTNKSGQNVVDPLSGEECSTMSEASKARAGVLLKHLAAKAGISGARLREHERNLLDEMCQEDGWCGKAEGEYHDKIVGDHNVKALIDDSTSGGLEIVPIEFDADLISFPLLNGELFPNVNIKPVPRGRRVEGASIDTPTMSWGGGDDSSITVFSTTSMVDAIDTTIFAIDAAIEVGRDFLSDSPVAVGETLTGLLGERLRNELDKVIANGNGTTQPEGVFVKSGLSTVASDNGAGGPPSLDDYESLMFAIGKQYRNPAMRPVFISNDTSYQRSKAIEVDGSGGGTDQRPVLSPLTEINNYKNLGWDHKIENNLANTAIGFGCLAKYRMYRRLGFSIEWFTGGTTLARRNMALLIVRGRFGGQIMDINAFAKMTGAQT